jgi:hypothetical protein
MMRQVSPCRVGALLLMLALSAVARQAAAQITSGSVTGSIRDSQGGVIPGASVILVSAARGTSLEVTSNEQGDFAFPIVEAETYVLRVGLAGFKTLTRPGIIVHAGDRVSLGVVTIEVGEIAETVTVLADSPQLQVRTAERSFAVEGQAVQNIAVNGRGFLNLALLAPGVVSTATPGQAPGAHTLSANGQRTNSNNVQIDGVTDMDTGNNGGPMVEVSLDSIQEVKVLTSNYQAEYGRSAGAQISAVTKSGGRAFHGSGYWFRRNDDLNANTWINNRNTPKTPVPPLDHRDVGYTIGGPVLLPGSNADRTKLFFFWSQEYQSRLTRRRRPCASGCQRTWSARATSPRPATTPGISSRSFATTRPACPAARPIRAAVSRMEVSLDAFPRVACTASASTS